jgi:hypothetical protein
MVTTRNLSLALGTVALALTAWLVAPAFAETYATSSPPASPAPAPQNSAIQYVYFDPAASPTPAASGWVSGGRYNLPPDIGGATVDATAFGSIMKDSSGNPSVAFVVRLAIVNNGQESMLIDPASVRLVDRAGRMIVGARAFSGQNRVTEDTIGPGGKETLQLEFPLPASVDLKTLEIEDVDLPYLYGQSPYVTQLKFVPAGTKETYAAPRTATVPEYPNPSSNSYTYNYYPAPYDNSAGYTTDYGLGYGYDYGYGYPYYGWGSSWWPGFTTFGFVGDGDFDRDDGFFGRRHFDRDDFGKSGGVTTDPALAALRSGKGVNNTTTHNFGNTKGITSNNTSRIESQHALVPNNFGNVGRGVGNNVTRGEGSRILTTNNFGQPFKSENVTTARNFGSVRAGTTMESTHLFAPRTGGTTFTAPNISTPHVNTAPSFTPRSFSTEGNSFRAPSVSSYRAPSFSGGSSFRAPSFSSYRAPSFSGGSSFRAPSVSTYRAPSFSGGSSFRGGGGGSFHGGGGGRR